mgnify:CR=1 FL=1
MRLPSIWPFPGRTVKDLWSTMAYGRSFLGCTVGWQRLRGGRSLWAVLWVAPHGSEESDPFEGYR